MTEVANDQPSAQEIFADQFNLAVQQIDNMLLEASGDLDRFRQKYFTIVRSVILMQARELQFFRELEHHIVGNTLNEETLQRITNSLLEMRRQFAAANSQQQLDEGVKQNV